MEKRRKELMELNSYIEGIDNKLTTVLQTLQWDRKHFLQNPMLVTCRYDSNHKVPPDKTEEHEKECFLRQNGYSKDDQLLPDPLDLESNTLVKLKKEDIKQIIANASRSDCLFKKVNRKIVQQSEPPDPFCILNQGVGCREAEPLSLERLQVSYTADERHAIHDAVVSAVPSCHDLNDLALLSGAHDKSSRVILSRQEILFELRNMRRRRTKYRVAAKSSNYSDVLRDVIRTQMEHYTDGKNDGKTETEPNETVDRDTNQRDTHNKRNYSTPAAKEHRSRHDGKIVPKPIKIKIEREDSTDRNRNYSRERSDRAYRHESGSRDRRDRHSDRRRRDDRSREKRYDDDLEKSQKYGEHSRKRRYDGDTRERLYYDEENGKNEYRTDNEYRSDKKSKQSHRHKDYDPEYPVKKEPRLDDELNNTHRDTSREKRDESHRHKDKKERRRDRERSKERSREKHGERPSERIRIKQEKEDSVTRDDTINYEKEKADRKRKSISKRHDRSNRDASCDSHSLGIKQEKYDRYYDGPAEEIYDPNKKIKVEK